jgi:hypothetical protein
MAYQPKRQRKWKGKPKRVESAASQMLRNKRLIEAGVTFAGHKKEIAPYRRGVGPGSA